MMGGSWCLLSATLLLWVTLAVPHPHPIQESDSAEIPERLRELLLIRRLISTLNGWDGSSPTDVQPGMRESSLQHELDQLGKASAANIDFRNLRVTGRSIRSFCSTNTDRQCRNFCFNLGDPACAEGDMGGNGEDSNFLGGANTPGK
ncbi:uncharacterized protein LOC121870205 [Homarus americanus]|uniref:uncharacterized protein LOC121870205 n=1 Tax=Homarus americanus TaxID=6706 RepID=UPI001C45131F|nr:uncharacterized protein LOC121870205 [Homarus americanus]XP_042227909.1 uncharacterized protein LOC121870205 [Homarus americanus]